MEVFFVTAVMTSLIVMAGLLVNRNLKYRALATADRWYAAVVISVQVIVLVCDLLLEENVFSRLPFDLLFSAVSLSLLTGSLVVDKARKTILMVILSMEALLALYYVMCMADLLPMPSHEHIRLLSGIMTVAYVLVFLYCIWYKVRDIHALMQSASVWSWLTFAVDVFYVLSVIIIIMFFHLLPPSLWLMALLSTLMTGLVLAYLYRINSDSSFALLYRHERAIVESMKISSIDAATAGSGEEYMYKEIFERVQKYFEEEKPFLNGDLTINDVVAEVFSNKVYISRAISHFTGRNFCQYVNYHRVMYAIECYRNNTSLKVSELWPMCGFNTIVSFNMAFRLFMNENPSDWCRKEKMKLCRKRK